MKIKNLSFVICLLSLLLFFFCFSTIYDRRSAIVLAIDTPTVPAPTTQTTTPPSTTSEQNILAIITAFFKNLFSTSIKTDYKINPNIQPDPTRFMSYGKVGDSSPYGSANRYRSSNSQFCDKGNVILNVLSGSEPDTSIVSDINTDCKNIFISNLAYYKLQKNEPFYCDETKQPIAISEDIKNKIMSMSMNVGISLVADSCYINIYNNFFLANPGLENNSDKAEKDENAKKITQQVIFKTDQPNPDTNRALYNKAAKGIVFKGQNTKKGFNTLKFK